MNLPPPNIGGSEPSWNPFKADQPLPSGTTGPAPTEPGDTNCTTPASGKVAEQPIAVSEGSAMLASSLSVLSAMNIAELLISQTATPLLSTPPVPAGTTFPQGEPYILRVHIQGGGYNDLIYNPDPREMEVITYGPISVPPAVP